MPDAVGVLTQTIRVRRHCHPTNGLRATPNADRTKRLLAVQLNILAKNKLTADPMRPLSSLRVASVTSRHTIREQTVGTLQCTSKTESEPARDTTKGGRN